MSAPIVSGAAALLWQAAPSLTAQQVFRGVVANGVSDVLAVPATAVNSPNLLVQVRTRD
jgi:subtilisin family serine protease